MRLNDEQRAAYQRDGFVLLEGLIAEEKLARWAQRFEDLVLERIRAPERLVVMKDIMVVGNGGPGCRACRASETARRPPGARPGGTAPCRR